MESNMKVQRTTVKRMMLQLYADMTNPVLDELLRQDDTHLELGNEDDTYNVIWVLTPKCLIREEIEYRPDNRWGDWHTISHMEYRPLYMRYIRMATAMWFAVGYKLRVWWQVRCMWYQTYNVIATEYWVGGEMVERVEVPYRTQLRNTGKWLLREFKYAVLGDFFSRRRAWLSDRLGINIR